jgi:hypothetical protein
MIPDAMREMGWEMAPKLMEHWFEIIHFIFTLKEKKKLDEYAKLTIIEELISQNVMGT